MKIFVLTVIPLQKSLPKDALSYFTSKDVSVGDIVEVPFRTQYQKAIVLHIKPIEKEKTALKEAKFKLRPVKTIVGSSPFDADIFTVGNIVNEYYVGNAIQFFHNLIPQSILSLSEKIETNTQKSNNFFHRKYIFQHSEHERFSYYKSFIREKFAKKQSVRICVPTIHQGNILFENLKKGIESYCVFMHSKLTKKQLEESFETTQKEHSVCFIHTPQFLSIPREDCDTLIVEFESSSSYQSQRKPYIDYRIFAETLALHKKQNFILADTFVRTETFARYESKEIEPLQKINFTIPNKNNHVLLDMKTQKHKIFHSQVIENIKTQYSAQKQILLFSLRASLATSTVCNDCGGVVMYKGSPVTLHKNPETGARFFKSKKFNKTFTSNIVCKECGSWNLVGLGIGTEKIEHELKEINSDFTILRGDQNTLKTKKQEKYFIEKIQDRSKPYIAIVGPKALPFLQDNFFETGCIVSLDSLFNIPQFNMYEKIIHTLYGISKHITDTLFFQTRYTDQEITNFIEKKKTKLFFEYDILERKNWNYPPYATIIKCIREINIQNIVSIQKFIETTFSNFDVYTYQTSGKTPRTKILHVILQVPNKAWPSPVETNPADSKEHEELKKTLHQLKNTWDIMVNPHTLF